MKVQFYTEIVIVCLSAGASTFTPLSGMARGAAVGNGLNLNVERTV